MLSEKKLKDIKNYYFLNRRGKSQVMCFQMINIRFKVGDERFELPTPAV